VEPTNADPLPDRYCIPMIDYYPHTNSKYKWILLQFETQPCFKSNSEDIGCDIAHFTRGIIEQSKHINSFDVCTCSSMLFIL
jgi:hypothetical protein